jgi:hypothetical protein
MEKGAANINRLIVTNLRNYSDLTAAVQGFLSDPGEDQAAILDECFSACEQGHEAIRAAVANVALISMGQEATDEEGKLSVGGVEDEDGIRLG